MCQIKRRSFLGSAAMILGGDMAARKKERDHSHGETHEHESSDAVRHQISAISLMTETANRFLAALDPEQQAKATFPFDDDQRMDWHYIPKERKGLPLREMTPFQKHLA